MFTVKPAGKKLSCKSSDEKVATVDAYGNVTAVGVGEATITANSKYAKKAATVKVTVKNASLSMTNLTVKKTDTLEATFASKVDAADVDFALTLNGAAVVINKVDWDAAGTVATITTTNKMNPGTYTLTATSKKDAADQSAKDATVEKQKVTEITFSSEKALTGKKGNTESMQAFVYYDVLDQYGDSMRTSASIQWSSSVSVVSKDTNTGKLTLERTDGKAFTYNEQVYVTGVHAQTGVSKTATFTIGQTQAVNDVKMAGFIKKGTTTILTSLPADFKSNAYYMLYNVTDQNGDVISAGRSDVTTTAIEDVTFISDNVMVIKEIKTPGSVVTIDGNDYDTVLVQPGIKVEDGGEVTVTAIASKTGNKSSLLVPVNMGTVIKSFEIGSIVGGILADGEEVELTYTALDEKGNKVTDFETIAKQETFNKLQLTASTGNIALVQNNDGSAKLKFADTDKSITWNGSKASDGQDRIVTLNAIVVGGETHNTTLYISDKARPVAVKSVNLGTAYLEGDTATLELYRQHRWDGNAYITYVDQYGRQLCCTDAKAFFDASANLTIENESGYAYGVQVTYTGNGNSALSAKKVILDATNPTTTITMGENVSGTASESIKLAVVKTKAAETSEVSKNVSKSYDVVDITKLSDIKVKDISKVYVKTGNSSNNYLSGANSTDDSSATIDASYYDNGKDKVKIEVEGTYKGSTMNVRSDYFVASAKEKFVIAKDSDNVYRVDAVSSGAIVWGDLYNFASTSANYVRKDNKDTVEVVVSEIYGDNVGTSVVSLTKPVAYSDEAPKGATLTASVKERTLGATNAVLGGYVDSKYDDELLTVWVDGGCPKWHYAAPDAIFSLKDQYGRDFGGEKIVYTVKDVKEADAYADNSVTLKGNATNEITIDGAERGDTFTLVASYKDLSVSVAYTVGADSFAFINDSGNAYLNVLIKEYLEPLRTAGLN